jgi:cell division protein FtsB
VTAEARLFLLISGGVVLTQQTSYWITHRKTAPRARRLAITSFPSISVPADVLSALREGTRFIPSNAVLGMILLASILVCVTVITRTRAELQNSLLNYQQMRDEVTSARRINAALTNDIERAQFDPITIEAIARDRLGMVRPGDLVVPVDIRAPASSLNTSVR